MLCILTYEGKGYNKKFIQNLTRIVSVLNSEKQKVMLVKGVDDICQPICHDTKEHCHALRLQHRDVVALNSINKVMGQKLQKPHLKIGSQVTIQGYWIQSMRQHFKDYPEHMRKACYGCMWHNVCTQMAQQNFKRALLKSGYFDK